MTTSPTPREAQTAATAPPPGVGLPAAVRSRKSARDQDHNESENPRFVSSIPPPETAERRCPECQSSKKTGPYRTRAHRLRLYSPRCPIKNVRPQGMAPMPV